MTVMDEEKDDNGWKIRFSLCLVGGILRGPIGQPCEQRLWRYQETSRTTAYSSSRALGFSLCTLFSLLSFTHLPCCRVLEPDFSFRTLVCRSSLLVCAFVGALFLPSHLYRSLVSSFLTLSQCGCRFLSSSLHSPQSLRSVKFCCCFFSSWVHSS